MAAANQFLGVPSNFDLGMIAPMPPAVAPQAPVQKQIKDKWCMTELRTFFNAFKRREEGLGGEKRCAGDKKWDEIAHMVGTKNKDQVRNFYYNLLKRMSTMLKLQGKVLDKQDREQILRAMACWWELVEETQAKSGVGGGHGSKKGKKKGGDDRDEVVVLHRSYTPEEKLEFAASLCSKVEACEAREKGGKGRARAPAVSAKKRAAGVAAPQNSKKRKGSAGNAGLAPVATGNRNDVYEIAPDDCMATYDFGLGTMVAGEMPPEFKVKLKPRTLAVRDILLGSGYHPQLELVVKNNKRIKSILDHLAKKWPVLTQRGQIIIYPSHDFSHPGFNIFSTGKVSDIAQGHHVNGEFQMEYDVHDPLPHAPDNSYPTEAPVPEHLDADSLGMGMAMVSSGMNLPHSGPGGLGGQQSAVVAGMEGGHGPIPGEPDPNTLGLDMSNLSAGFIATLANAAEEPRSGQEFSGLGAPAHGIHNGAGAVKQEPPTSYAMPAPPMVNTSRGLTFFDGDASVDGFGGRCWDDDANNQALLGALDASGSRTHDKLFNENSRNAEIKASPQRRPACGVGVPIGGVRPFQHLGRGSLGKPMRPPPSPSAHRLPPKPLIPLSPNTRSRTRGDTRSRDGFLKEEGADIKVEAVESVFWSDSLENFAAAGPRLGVMFGGDSMPSQPGFLQGGGQ